MTTLNIKPADLLLTRSTGWASWMIRFGAALRDRPNLVNHVAIVHHIDKEGTVWCIEGRPGGVGWRDAKDYLSSPHTMCNYKQPKDEAQRKIVTDGAVAMLGTPYDWEAIASDAANSFPGLANIWNLKWGPQGTVPGHVVCSSLAAFLYDPKAKLARPEGDREVAPADWLALWIDRGWATRP